MRSYVIVLGSGEDIVLYLQPVLNPKSYDGAERTLRTREAVEGEIKVLTKGREEAEGKLALVTGRLAE